MLRQHSWLPAEAGHPDRKEAIGLDDGDSDAASCWDEQDAEDRECSKKEGRHGVRPYNGVGEEDKSCTLDVHCHMVVAWVLRREGACHTDAYEEEGKEHEGRDAFLVVGMRRHLEERVRCFRLLLPPSLQSWKEK